VGLAASALLLGSLPARADIFQQMWMGRIARPPADNERATGKTSGTRGKRFKPNEVSRARRTEAFGTIFIVSNIDNAKKIECPV
jgi:rare lipoprotein A